MARLTIGIVLLICFVLSLAAAAAFGSPLSPAPVLLFGVVLLVPGIALIVLGRRRVTLFRKVGGAVMDAARKTGRVNIADIAGRTQSNPDEVRLVVAELMKKGIMPRDVDVS